MNNNGDQQNKHIIKIDNSGELNKINLNQGLRILTKTKKALKSENKSIAFIHEAKEGNQ